MVGMTETVPDVRKRPGGRAARVRDAILAATRDEFDTSGYGGLSAGRIAERAGVNRSTIHRRWDTLDDLLADALVDRAATAIPAPDTGSTQEDLQVLLRTIASYISTDAARARILAMVGDAARSPAIGALASSVFTTRFRVGEDVISRGAARGEIRDDIPPADIFAMLIGPLYVRLLLTNEPIDDTFISNIIGTVLDGALTRKA
jgi:AcrR family transcriptional regulator